MIKLTFDWTLTGPKCQMDLKSKIRPNIRLKGPKIGHETEKVENWIIRDLKWT